MPALYTPLTADIPTALQLSTWVPLFARKAADQAITSNAVLTADPQLFIANLAANAVYEVDLYVLFRAGAAGLTPGMKVDFTAPVAADVSNLSFELSGTMGPTGAGGTVQGINGATGNAVFKIFGHLIMAATPGTLQFRTAQNNSSATALTVAAGSALHLTQVA